MARNATSLALSVASLAFVVIVMGLTIGLESGKPLNLASEAAVELHKRLDLPYARVMMALETALLEGWTHRSMVRTKPLYALAALLMVRLALELRQEAMARKAVPSAWNVASLGIILCVIGLTIGLEFGLPVNRASENSVEIGRRLNLPEERVRGELETALWEGWTHRIVVRTIPLFALAALLIVRLAQEWGGARQEGRRL